MKKLFFFLVITFCHFVIIAKPNYNNGNGTIIFETVEGNKKTEIRKCEMAIIIGSEIADSSKIIYDDYKTCNEIGKLESGDSIQILEICTIKFSEKPSDKWGFPYGERWYKIKIKELIGWIHISISSVENYNDPYYENRFEILDTFELNGKRINARKLNQIVTVWESLNIRNLPDVKNTSVIYTIRPGEEDPYQTNVEVIAISEDKETIDNITDYWLKIKYKDYEGWIFGGYTTVERGGAKYYFPEVFIKSELD